VRAPVSVAQRFAGEPPAAALTPSPAPPPLPPPTVVHGRTRQRVTIPLRK